MSLTSEDTIRKTVDRAWGRFSFYREQVLSAQALYRNEFTPKTPSSISEPIKLSDAARICDEIADHVLIRYVQVNARATGPSDEIAAEKRSKLLSGMWHMVYQQSQWNPVREAVKNFPMCGVSALKVVPDVPGYERMQEKPDQGEGEKKEDYDKRVRRRERMAEYFFPFWVTAPNPAWLGWDLGPRRPEWFSERNSRTGESMLEEFPELEDKLNPDNTYPCYEYWDEETFAFVVNGTEFAIYRRNKIGIPYAVKFGGTGAVDDLYSPEHIARGLLTRERSAIIENSTTYNQTVSVGRKLAWPNYYTDRADLMAVIPGYGRVALLPSGEMQTEHFRRMDLGSVDPMLFNLLEMQQSKLDRETTPTVLRGIRQPGTSSAAEAAIQNQNVRMMLEATILATKGLLELSNVTFLRCIDECFPEGVRVYGRSPYGWDYDQKVDSGDIDGAYANEVEIMAGPPEDLDRQAELSAGLVEKGVRSLETHLREGERRQDPKQEMANIITDQALRSDQNVNLVAGAIARLTETYLLERGLVTAQRSLAQTTAGQPTLLEQGPTTGEAMGLGTFQPPNSPEGVMRAQNEMANAQAGQSDGMARLLG